MVTKDHKNVAVWQAKISVGDRAVITTSWGADPIYLPYFLFIFSLFYSGDLQFKVLSNYLITNKFTFATTIGDGLSFSGKSF